MRTYKILLVEDDAANQFFTEKTLIKNGYDPVIVQDANEAQKWCSENKPDLILMDISLPDMDGFELAILIRELDHIKKVPIIALTAYPLRQGIDKALSSKMNDYLPKPFSEKQLLEAIEALLRKAFPEDF